MEFRSLQVSAAALPSQHPTCIESLFILPTLQQSSRKSGLETLAARCQYCLLHEPSALQKLLGYERDQLGKRVAWMCRRTGTCAMVHNPD
jgi:hypothetical protein